MDNEVTPTQATPSRLIRRREVEQLTGLKKSQIYALMRKGLFPRPIRIGERAVAWTERALVSWQESRPAGGGLESGGKGK